MRFTTFALLGASSLALTGCSFLSDVFGHNDYNRTAVPAPYTQGAYHGAQVPMQGAYHAGQGAYSHNAQGTYITRGSHYGSQTTHHAPQHSAHQARSASHGCCVGGNQLSKWNIEGGIGPAFLIGGEAVTGDKLNAGNPNQINTIDMSDAYDNGIRADLGASYAVTPNRKITGQVFVQNHESSGDLNWGTVNGQQLTGALSDYKSYGAELGVRQYFQPTHVGIGVRPYVEGKLGGAYVDDIAVEGTQLGGAVFSADDLAFYEGGWVPTGAGLVGIETPVADRLTLGLETGVRYIGKQKSADSDLVPGGPISGSNNGGDSWTIPVTLRGRYRF